MRACVCVCVSFPCSLGTSLHTPFVLPFVLKWVHQPGPLRRKVTQDCFFFFPVPTFCGDLSFCHLSFYSMARRVSTINRRPSPLTVESICTFDVWIPFVLVFAKWDEHTLFFFFPWRQQAVRHAGRGRIRRSSWISYFFFLSVSFHFRCICMLYLPRTPDLRLERGEHRDDFL